MNETFWAEFKKITKKLIEKVLAEKGFFNLYDDGQINALSSDGKRADVNVNGSTDVTPSIPIREGLSLVVGDEVRILNVNFNRKDRIIDHKKIL